MGAIRGTAADTGGRVGGVEVSVDNGASWHPATGREAWSYSWTPDRLGAVTLLSRAADAAQLPAYPEFRAAIMGYAEWGTRLALANSQPGAEPPPKAPVPQWGWGEAPPYLPGS